MKLSGKGSGQFLFLAALLIVTAVSCGKHEYRAPNSAVGFDKAPQAAMSGRGGEGEASTPASRELPATERKQIVSVNMSIEVDEVKKRATEAEKIAKEFNGYVFMANISQRRGFENAQITIMVPANNLEGAVAKIEKLGTVENQTQTTDDVTRQFIDLTARLNNYKKEESALADLLSKPGKIEEILKVENELSRVRSEIERMQGELNFLEKQTSFSQIHLNLKAQAAPAGFKNWPIRHTIKRATMAFLYTGRALISLAIYVAFFLPFVILVYLVYRILKWWLSRNKPQAGH
jgi:hypothetical protein